MKCTATGAHFKLPLPPPQTYLSIVKKCRCRQTAPAIRRYLTPVNVVQSRHDLSKHLPPHNLARRTFMCRFGEPRQRAESGQQRAAGRRK